MQPKDVFIRPARLGDQDQAASVLRASISELCIADHGNDAAIVARWLSNKTPDQVRAWIEAPGLMVVAEEGTQIIGVGAATSSGGISLNYVAPQARFQGVSKAMLRALEDHLRAQGQVRSTLFSTRTARQFYRAAGYADAGEPEKWGGLTAFPMAKDLS